MTTKQSRRPRVVAPEWRGFPARLSYALRWRMDEAPELTQNEIAAAAGVDSGNFSKMLDGSRPNVLGSTVIQLAKALRVEVLWLLTGKEPSGLDGSEPIDIQTFDAAPARTARDDVSDAPSKGKAKRLPDVRLRALPDRDKA